MTKIRVSARWDGQTFVPDAVFLEDCATIGRGREVMLTVEQSRSIQHHRWFFAVLKSIIAAGYHEGDEEALLDDIKEGINFGSYRTNWRGERRFRGKSISFDRCDELRFKRFVHYAERWLATELGVDVETIFAEADRETGHAVDRRAA